MDTEKEINTIEQAKNYCTEYYNLVIRRYFQELDRTNDDNYKTLIDKMKKLRELSLAGKFDELLIDNNQDYEDESAYDSVQDTENVHSVGITGESVVTDLERSILSLGEKINQMKPMILSYSEEHLATTGLQSEYDQMKKELNAAKNALDAIKGLKIT